MTNRTLSPDQVAALRAEFGLIDQNSDGFITQAEVATLLSRESYAHLSAAGRQQVLDSFAKADTDGNGVVDFEEFVIMMTTEPDPREEIRRIFDALDLDGDGFLTTADFERISKERGAELTKEQAEAMIRMADANDDGVVSFDEYYAMVTTGRGG